MCFSGKNKRDNYFQTSVLFRGGSFYTLKKNIFQQAAKKYVTELEIIAELDKLLVYFQGH